MLALPVLVEEPDESSEGLFARLYANALAAHLATSDPRIEQVFARWRAGAGPVGPLEAGTDAARTLLEEKIGRAHV